MAERQHGGRIADPVIIFDTETTIDPTQKLNFGFACYGLDYGCEFRRLAEILFYSDDLPERDPSGFKNLAAYAKTHYEANIDNGENAEPRLLFLSRTEFVNKWLWSVGYMRQGLIVGFNLPFDLTRLALSVGEARRFYAGGFSLKIWKTNMRPRICYKTIANKRAFIGFTKIDSPEGRDGYRGRFLDLRTLAFALSSKGHSLRSACQAYGVQSGKAHTEEHGTFTTDYINYGRQDLTASVGLYQALMNTYRSHGIDTPAHRLFSAASLSKAYFAKMGLTPPLERIDDYSINNEVLGCAAQAFYGGRAEAHIRKVPVPVSVVDFTSMYPTVNALMGGWDLLSAGTICAEDATASVQGLLDNVSLSDCFDPGLWPMTLGVASITPSNDILPVRAQYDGQSWGIGINHFRSDRPMWYSIADLIASVLLTGRVPKVEKAYRFYGECELASLRPIPLGVDEWLDPDEDMFKGMVDKRQLLKGTPAGDFLKIFSNAGSYGIYAEQNRDAIKGSKYVNVYSGDTRLGVRTNINEVPGKFAFPPLAACITGGARLMLAMLESCVTELGGTYAMCDTDSMAIVASDNLRELHHRNYKNEYDRIPILSRAQVGRIQSRFNALNPYENVPDVLKLEHENVECYAISAKRYCLFHLDSDRNIVIDKASNHGLGHLLNPMDMDSESRDWIAEIWSQIIRGKNRNYPPWIFRPALSPHTITGLAMFRQFKSNEECDDYQDQIKPANFVLIAHPTRWSQSEHKQGPISLYAPYERDPDKWHTLRWVNKFDGMPWTIATKSIGDVNGHCIVKTYYDVITEYQGHPEYSACDSDGLQCGVDTTGILHRMYVGPDKLHYIGKEGNNLDAAEVGLAAPGDICHVYGGDTGWDYWRPLVLPVFHRHYWSPRDVLRYSGADVSLKKMSRIMTGDETPPAGVQSTLRQLAVDTATLEMDCPDEKSISEILTRYRDLGPLPIPRPRDSSAG